jgi:hypothetical protein
MRPRSRAGQRRRKHHRCRPCNWPRPGRRSPRPRRTHHPRSRCAHSSRCRIGCRDSRAGRAARRPGRSAASAWPAGPSPAVAAGPGPHRSHRGPRRAAQPRPDSTPFRLARTRSDPACRSRLDRAPTRRARRQRRTRSMCSSRHPHTARDRCPTDSRAARHHHTRGRSAAVGGRAPAGVHRCRSDRRRTGRCQRKAVPPPRRLGRRWRSPDRRPGRRLRRASGGRPDSRPDPARRIHRSGRLRNGPRPRNWLPRRYSGWRYSSRRRCTGPRSRSAPALRRAGTGRPPCRPSREPRTPRPGSTPVHSRRRWYRRRRRTRCREPCSYRARSKADRSRRNGRRRTIRSGTSPRAAGRRCPPGRRRVPRNSRRPRRRFPNSTPVPVRRRPRPVPCRRPLHPPPAVGAAGRARRPGERSAPPVGDPPTRRPAAGGPELRCASR